MNIKNIIIKLIGYLHYPENYLVDLGLSCGNAQCLIWAAHVVCGDSITWEFLLIRL